ncbi:4-hydroxy-tetrahydrodipicolinate reductase [Chryseobacterium profundimaris]|uniref:4-hydroxy-tetrahydrodipicolinate reductase n=1 Tax=Chryseobacterium profundimaris TaxID=1387275 RepID=A0ABY1NY63_9FLAO|nr:dihydrodipicolinate reductase C-terminal domain-containing protein [Chryseobacterium profundimaris]SMP21533.1 4-hydroxy-tetrahydrodipicolinate reductase [Chryseobacterium profundimaris]
MKIGLIGFGKAGKAVANVILSSEDFSLEWVLKNKIEPGLSTAKEALNIETDDLSTIYSRSEINMDQFFKTHPVDIIIDFSDAESILQYGSTAAGLGVKIISAISHYQDGQIDFLKELSKVTTVFWSPNITLGVNYLLFAASLLKNIAPGVDIELIEEHFKSKSGISGTAVRIAETLDLETESINSVRAGGIVGKHEVIFGFPYQTVRLVHESISREAFGSGALFVAENIKNKKEGFYNFEDILRPYFFGQAGTLS